MSDRDRTSLFKCLVAGMAANYWASTQRRHWQFSRENLTEIRQQLEDEDRSLVQQYPLPDRRLLSKFLNERMFFIKHSSCAPTKHYQSWQNWASVWV